MQRRNTKRAAVGLTTMMAESSMQNADHASGNDVWSADGYSTADDSMNDNDKNSSG